MDFSTGMSYQQSQIQQKTRLGSNNCSIALGSLTYVFVFMVYFLFML